MKRIIFGFAALAASAAAMPAQAQDAAKQSSGAKVEYVDIRWDSGDRMCVIYPEGKVVFVGEELRKAYPRPDDANQRAFYTTIEMNKLAAQGYEFVAMISDEIVMKRTVSR